MLSKKFEQLGSEQIDKAAVERINAVYSKILENINHNKVESNNLADMRDTLLPKLMSGELKINEIDC